MITEERLEDLFIFDRSGTITGYDIRGACCRQDECYWGINQNDQLTSNEDHFESCTEHYRSEHGGPPLAILNMSTVTADGRYSVETVTPELARTIMMTRVDIESYVGHADTASILTEVLGREIEYKPKRMLEQQVGQWVLVAKLNDRPQHGRRLTRDELIEIGFTFKILIRTS